MFQTKRFEKVFEIEKTTLNLDSIHRSTNNENQKQLTIQESLQNPKTFANREKYIVT